MEETKNKLEQPLTSNLNSQCEKSMSNIESRAEVSEDKNGSNNFFGKFKSGEELLKAYNFLQSDYTRKCQALAESEKQLEDKEKEIKNNIPPQEVLNKVKNKQEEFYSSFPEAKEFAKVLEEKVKGKDFLQDSNPFLQVWQEFKQENFISPSKLIEDEKFLQNYVYGNKKITDKILKDYFNSLQKESSPVLISAQPGSKTILSPVKRPKTIEEAGKIASDMFL